MNPELSHRLRTWQFSQALLHLTWCTPSPSWWGTTAWAPPRPWSSRRPWLRSWGMTILHPQKGGVRMDSLGLFYRLEGVTPVSEQDLVTWEAWFVRADRQVARIVLPGGGLVSTIFVGLDMGLGCGAPQFFETMIFATNGTADGEAWRYATWHQAEQGHEAAVAVARGLAQAREH